MNRKRSWKRTILQVLIVSSLVLMPGAAYAASTPVSVTHAETSSELNLALSQSWIQNELGGSASYRDVITGAEFVKLIEAAAREAGQESTLSIDASEQLLYREQAAEILNSVIQVPDADASMYSDVTSGKTYSKAIMNVTKAGLMNGVGSKTFGYGQAFTRAEAAVVAYRFYQYSLPFHVVETSVSEIQKAMESGRLTSVELVQLYLERIEKYDQQGTAINSVLTINSKAIDIAQALDEERAKKGARGPLHGIPIIVKDNYDTADMPTTSGNIGLKDVIPPDDATQIKQLKEAGAIILAKANLHEFAFGYTTQSSLGGQTLNPYDLSHVPGGSSGGTAAAVAANLAVLGMGTDTGGSIRIPSSFNSLVGIRPTVGLTSRDGIVPLASTQDTGGPMARSVADAATVLNATVAYDPKDPATAKHVTRVPSDYTDYLIEDGLKGARIGVVREVFGSNPDIIAVMEQAIQDMKAAGAVIVDDVSIPNFDKINTYGSLSTWEFKFQFNDYLASLGDAAPYKSLDELIISGQYDPSIEAMLNQRNARESLSAQEYKDIVLFRTQYVQEAVLKMMADNDLDALIFPTSANPPVQIGEEQTVGDGFKLSSFTGWPTVTVPAGFTKSNLPVGLDLFGRAFSEAELIKLAYSYEQYTLHRKTPQLTP